MPEDTASQPPKIPDAFGWAEETFGIPKVFFETLLSDSDWVFAIKIHGLMEAALNHLITTHFRNENLSEIIARLETSNSDQGKLAFIKACDLLPSELRRFVKQISELRNKFVHNLQNFGLTIPEFAASLDKKQRQNWRESLSGGWTFPIGCSMSMTPLQVVDIFPRNAILSGVFKIVSIAAEKHGDRISSDLASFAPVHPESNPKEQQ